MATLSQSRFDTSSWEVKYELFIQNSELQKYLELKDTSLIPYLLELLLNDEFAWEANLLLYALTNQNAINMASYSPDKKELWLLERKELDRKYWKTFALE